MNKKELSLTVREKITIKLVMFLIHIVGAYEYEHQVKQYFEDLNTLLKA